MGARRTLGIVVKWALLAILAALSLALPFLPASSDGVAAKIATGVGTFASVLGIAVWLRLKWAKVRWGLTRRRRAVARIAAIEAQIPHAGGDHELAVADTAALLRELAQLQRSIESLISILRTPAGPGYEDLPPDNRISYSLQSPWPALLAIVAITCVGWLALIF